MDLADILIVSAEQDHDRVWPLVDALTQNGFTTNWMRKLTGDFDWWQEFLDAIRSSRCVFFVVTRSSVDSEAVRAEIATALKQIPAGHKAIVPVLMDEIEMPPALTPFKAADLVGWDGDPREPRLGHLFESVRSWIDDDSQNQSAEDAGFGSDTTSNKTDTFPSSARPAASKRPPPATPPGAADQPTHSGTARRWRRRLRATLRGAAVLALAIAVVGGAAVLIEAGRARLAVGDPPPMSAPCVHIPGEGPEMVVVPAGRFRRGDLNGTGVPAERPIREVTIRRAFAVSRCEVTFAEYEVFAEATDRAIPNDAGWGGGRQPVINVSWEDATAYAEWLTAATGKRYRLPTEAEWEYVARAGTETDYWWGNDVREGGQVWANCSDCGSEWDGLQAAPVGSFPANPFGLHDTAGNVWEWTQDCWNDNYEGAPTDGTAWLEGDCAQRVIRGGSWFFNPWNMRSSNRYRNFPDFRVNDLGFRLAQDLTPDVRPKPPELQISMSSRQGFE